MVPYSGRCVALPSSVLALDEELLAVPSPPPSPCSQVDPVSRRRVPCCRRVTTQTHAAPQLPHTRSPSRPHHLLTLTGPDQLLEEQLQHSLTVEQATPVQGGTDGRGSHSKSPPPLGQTRTQVGSSLFDEVLRLLTAQEDT